MVDCVEREEVLVAGIIFTGWFDKTLGESVAFDADPDMLPARTESGVAGKLLDIWEAGDGIRFCCCCIC